MCNDTDTRIVSFHKIHKLSQIDIRQAVTTYKSLRTSDGVNLDLFTVVRPVLGVVCVLVFALHGVANRVELS